MPETISGTNTERIDQLTAAVGDLRVQVADLRGEIKVFRVVNSILAAVSAIGVPGLLAMMYQQGQTIAALNANVQTLTAHVQRWDDRLTKLEAGKP
jgi:outer membrane murein-binding lipoprotein Lpp